MHHINRGYYDKYIILRWLLMALWFTRLITIIIKTISIANLIGKPRIASVRQSFRYLCVRIESFSRYSKYLSYICLFVGTYGIDGSGSDFVLCSIGDVSTRILLVQIYLVILAGCFIASIVITCKEIYTAKELFLARDKNQLIIWNKWV